MRVVQVYKDYDPPVHGGIEKHVATLSRFVARRGVEVEVLCSQPTGAAREEMDGPVRVRRCASPATVASTPLPPGLPAALWRSRADVVHLHYPWPPGELAYLLAGRGRRLVVTLHCEVVRYPRLAKLLRPLTERVLAAADSIIVASDALAALPMLARHRRRVEVVPYGIDLDRFSPAGPDEADPLPGLPHPRIVFVGRLRHYKGLDVLAAAMARLPEVRLVVVGDGPERSSFEASLRRAGALDRVHFAGDVEEYQLVTLLRGADAAVLPSTSRAEAFGLAVVEAQACGIPAVVTDVGTGTARTIDDGRSGRLVAAEDADALTAGIRWCLDERHTNERRAAARVHAEVHFSAGKMTDAIVDLYT